MSLVPTFVRRLWVLGVPNLPHKAEILRLPYRRQPCQEMVGPTVSSLILFS